jgi:kynurenine formamidase
VIIDLSHEIVAGMTTYPGTAPPEVRNPHRPARHGLLGADIPIIEHLTNLDRLPAEGARLTALPAPVRGMASFPVRAVATYGA